MALLLYLRSARWAAPLARQAPALSQAPVRGKRKKAGSRAAAAPVADDDSPEAIDLDEVDASMGKVVDSLERSFSRLRASGASADMLDDVRVEAYGTRSALRDLAQVSVRDGRTLAVNVFDPAVSSAVEKAIRGAGLNLNPVTDSSGIRVPVPRADRQAREGLRKKALGEAEKAKVAARHVRRDALTTMKKIKAEMALDEFKKVEKGVQLATDKCVGTIDKLAASKVKAIESA